MKPLKLRKRQGAQGVLGFIIGYQKRADLRGVEVTVDAVTKGGSAEVAGLRPGDIIESINNQDLTEDPCLVDSLGARKGEEIDLRLKSGVSVHLKAR